MDRTILNLLFNYKGKITAREFRVGNTLILLVIGFFVIALFDGNFFSQTIIEEGSYHYLYEKFRQVIGNHIPDFVPTGLILTYSSFVLGLKRMRSLSKNCVISILSGVVNYLFYTSLMSFFVLFKMVLKSWDSWIEITLLIPYWYIIGTMFFITGTANLIFLSIMRQSEHSALPKMSRKLDIFGFALKLERLIVILFVLSVIGITFFVALSPDPFLLIFIVLYIVSPILLLVLLLYIKYIIYRLRDAGKSIWWLVGILGGYFILLKLRIRIMDTSEIFFLFDILYHIVTSFFIASHFLLFLLPSKITKRDEQPE